VISQASVVLRSYEKQDLKQVDVISGISPDTMRRVFGGWILFSALVAVIVSVAPDLGIQFIGLTLFVLVSFTLVMFWQSRIAEGWPAIICDGSYIGVVSDPVKREFICAHSRVISSASSTLIKPNKKAVEINLNPSLLEDNDNSVLSQAVWPREGKLVGLVHFKHREAICERIMACVEKSSLLASKEANQASDLPQ